MKIGDKAVDFELYDTDLKVRSLKEFAGKNVVLAFYPGAFTSVCQKEMCTLRDSLSKFNKFNAQVIGISVDGPFANKAFAQQNMINFPILCDFERKVSKIYGGLHENFVGVKGYSVAKRSVFVVDKNGKIAYAWVSEDPGKEPNYVEIENTLSKLG
ncbi:MAG: peroxiredoxin [Mesoaciditoga sp.]|uniref:peroxiredoxin n=1 Tax=Athalassotoga sp. TaxID=2022597 RepID=UPI000CBE1329|nr:MAG: peroxiredoxin [Mesoaciditoga sp.]PMP79698.1 MAG: peroxiredoxin [Mesoaciditoga sp.]HEU24364.1 peroxiredoxin [Mesoaciditoga lauensis]